MNNIPDPYPQPPYHNPMDDEGIDFKRYLSLFISNWYWFFMSLFIALSLAYGINRWSEEIYTVTSTLLIKDNSLSGPSEELSYIFPGSNAYRSQQNLQNEIGILKSFGLNKRVMDSLPDFHVVYVKVGKRGIAESRLYMNSPFVVRYRSLQDQTFGSRVSVRIISDEKYVLGINGNKKLEREMNFGEQFTDGGFNFRIEKRHPFNKVFSTTSSNKYYFYFISPSSLASRYRSGLSVAPVATDASLVTLSTTGPVAVQEADYLNTLMDIYIKQGLELKNKASELTINFIDSQLGIISDSLVRAERNMENFRLGNRLIDISQEGASIQAKLERIDNEKATLLLQKRYYEYLRNYIESRNETGDIIAPSVVMRESDNLLIQLVNELSQLQKQKNQMAMSLNESQMPVRFLDESIVSLKKALSENIANGLQNIEEESREVESRLREVERSFNRLPSTERKLINIQRKFDINNTVYTYLLEKKAEAGIALAANVADNRVIDNAGPFSTSLVKPKKKRNYNLALLFGLLVPVAGMLILDALNNKVIDRKDIEKRTSSPIIGYISHNSLKNEMPVVENPGSTLSESFRSVRTNLKYFLKDKHCPVISVSSTISSEGKTFVAINLAAIMALSGRKVLLIGLDLRKPRIHKILDVENKVGLSNYLIDELEMGNVIIKTEIENLWYAASGPTPPNPAELIESEAMKKFIEHARKEYDYIIIDTPPVAIVTDALLVSQFTDLYLFVVRQRYTSRNTVDLIEELRESGNIKSIGIVINDISMSGYYGYGLRYGYALGYGYNYGYNYYSQYGKYGYSDEAKGYYTED
ncbi:MAG TPA: polysaccharide biosynthesis tyrosine autokinase [Bacteroidales bacterium]|nr:polysaccharide biosynthesis tyrosine autokinase [Bacteroidales bacterium]